MNKSIFFIGLLLILLIAISFKFLKKDPIISSNELEKEEVTAEISHVKNKNEIYLAGGCFWGVEGYFKKSLESLTLLLATQMAKQVQLIIVI